MRGVGDWFELGALRLGLLAAVAAAEKILVLHGGFRLPDGKAPIEMPGSAGDILPAAEEVRPAARRGVRQAVGHSCGLVGGVAENSVDEEGSA